MNVYLPKELEEFVRQKASKAPYRSASDVVRRALKLLQDTEQSSIVLDNILTARTQVLKRRVAEEDAITLSELKADDAVALSELGAQDKNRARRRRRTK